MTRARSLCAGAEPGVIEETTTDTDTDLARPWQVIVHDDPITLMAYVTLALQQVFGYPHSKAHSLMMDVHQKGRAIVWSGAKEQAELYVFKLHARQLLATVEPVQG